MPVCPKCASESVIKYGRARAKQRYKCAHCGCQFLAGAAVRHDLEEKLSAMSMLASGLSMHAVAKIFSVSVQTVWRWKNSGLIAHEQVSAAARIRKIGKTGKVRILRDNDPSDAREDDFMYGDIYAFEFHFRSGVRIDMVVKCKKKTITK